MARKRLTDAEILEWTGELKSYTRAAFNAIKKSETEEALQNLLIMAATLNNLSRWIKYGYDPEEE